MRGIVELPRNRDLDKIRFLLFFPRFIEMKIITHHAAVVKKPVFLQKTNGIGTQIPRRRAVASRALTSDLLQRFDSSDQNPFLFIDTERYRAFMDVAVMGDFVPLLIDQLYRVRMASSRLCRDEEGCLN